MGKKVKKKYMVSYTYSLNNNMGFGFGLLGPMSFKKDTPTASEINELKYEVEDRSKSDENKSGCTVVIIGMFEVTED